MVPSGRRNGKRKPWYKRQVRMPAPGPWLPRAEADALLERAEEEAQAISAKYRKMGDEFGRKKAAEILRIRKEQFAANVTAARERIPQAVAFILERIG